jgi:hypothetical protein
VAVGPIGPTLQDDESEVEGGGGALSASLVDALLIQRSGFAHNTAYGPRSDGGAIGVAQGVILDVRRSSFTNNSAQLHVRAGHWTLRRMQHQARLTVNTVCTVLSCFDVPRICPTLHHTLWHCN